MTALQIRGLGAGFGDMAVLRGVDLSVQNGVTAILGSSGCGKTTLLRCVAGFVTPSAGTIEVAGRPVVAPGSVVPARRRGIGDVPQEGALFPHLSVARNVAFGLPRSERRSAGAVVEEALRMVELDPSMAARFPHQLSGGQQQRVALARALAPRPALVLLDEPFSSLDASLREETGQAVVRAVRSAGAAAVLVTHDQGEALSLADQVAVMAQGQFLQVADPATIYLHPADPRVAVFIGHATLLPGEILGDGRGQCATGRVSVRASQAVGPAQFAIRSEQVVVRQPSSQRGTSDEVVQGEVVDVSFFGHDATVRLRIPGGHLLSARIPADQVPRRGDLVEIAIVGEVIAFPDR